MSGESPSITSDRSADGRVDRNLRASDVVRYWRKGEVDQNFGDYLSDLYLDRLFVGHPVPAEGIHLVGSVISRGYVSAVPLSAGRPPVVFWTCGARGFTGFGPDLRLRSEFRAIRGPLTSETLGGRPDLPTGDSGLFLPFLYTPKPALDFQGKTLGIPHFNDRRPDAELRERMGCELILRPTIRHRLRGLERFIDAIAAASFVLSGSLHGAIAALAYDRPFSFWSDGGLDTPFKWEDFSASVNVDCVFSANLTEGERNYSGRIQSLLRIPPLWPVLAAAPFAVQPLVMMRVVQADIVRHGAGVLHRPYTFPEADRMPPASLSL